MKIAVLQQFLRSLIPALEAANAQTANELAGAIAVFEPFQSLDVNAFAGFLVKAKAYQIDGKIAIPTAGQQQVEHLAKILERIGNATGGIAPLQAEAIAALQGIAGQAGIKGKLSPEPKWAGAREVQARLATHRKTLFELAARIASPEAFEEPIVREGIAGLAEQLDAPSLKALAGEHGVKVSKAQPVKTVTDLLAKLSGQQPPKAKPKSKKPVVDPAVVEEHSRRLTALIERSLQPNAVSDNDVDAEVSRLRDLPQATLYEVVTRAGIREARPSETKPALLKRVQNELMAARRARERAEV